MKSCARSLALVFSAFSLAASALTQGAMAQALQSYVLENVQTRSADLSAEVFIPRIEVVGANVTRADFEKLLTPDLPAAARAEITLAMQAQRIFAPQVVVTRTGKGEDKDTGRFVLRDYLVVNLDRARFDRITLGGLEGVMRSEDKGEGSIASGQITFEGGDFSKVAAAAKAGAPEDGVAKLRLFSWSGFEMSLPDTSLPATAAGGNMYRIGLKSMRANTDYAGDVPTKAVASLNGLYFYAPPATEVGRTLASFGYDRVEFGLNFDGAYNPATKSFVLTDYSFSGLNAGTLALAGAFADIDASTFTADSAGRLAALMKGKINGVDLRYVDAGLFDKALAFYAASQGKDVSAVRKEWAMMIVGMLPMLMGGDPASLKLSEALSAFVSQPKSLAISLKGKSGPVGMADLMKLADPMYLLSQVEITAVANR
ncbi:MAG: hypothetical protein K2Y29_06035 [Beijerinckiaceae bacterium]|nr:hypothetical protein [Beijerinckiaceae bacterium]